mmetsp:Transcript_8599/g.16268  ORF Transcript_8599/g.16268 Transcript_8599/m.16268 type:complete len:319 (+) Transcript_8599:60-1016(+)
MGNRCCTDRKSTSSSKVRDACDGVDGKNPNLKHDQASKSIVAFDGQKPIRSTSFQSRGDDADKFDKAFEANDIAGLVALLPSREAIWGIEEKMHPWAQDPQSVGALAGFQLSAMAQIAVEEEDLQMNVSIGEAGAIVPFVDFLRSGEENRVQTAVVAFSHLLSDCPSNVRVAYEAGAMELLMDQLEAHIAGMRYAAAKALRDIFVESDAYRRRFVSLGGLTALIKQLSGMSDSEQWTSDHQRRAMVDSEEWTANRQFEALLNLRDLLYDDSGNITRDYALDAMTAGVERRLQAIMQTDDEEVRRTAAEMLHGLSEVAK